MLPHGTCLYLDTPWAELTLIESERRVASYFFPLKPNILTIHEALFRQRWKMAGYQAR
jgi:hypothetical protein